MTICVCGNINQDIIFFLRRFPKYHEKITAKEFYMGCGGSAANTCWWLANLGCDTRMIGSVGNDQNGVQSINELEHVGVKIDSISFSKKDTGLAVVLSCGQDKRMIKVKGANEDIKFDKKYLKHASHIHISSLDIKVAKQMIDYASDNRIPISWDPSESIYPELLSKVDYLFINEDDWNRVSKKVEDYRPKNLVVTLNGGGCAINGKIRLPSPGDEAIDTTGAGDSFSAGFIYGLSMGFDIRTCGKWGIACSSFNIGEIGSRKGFKSKKDIEGKVSKMY